MFNLNILHEIFQTQKCKINQKHTFRKKNKQIGYQLIWRKVMFQLVKVILK